MTDTRRMRTAEMAPEVSCGLNGHALHPVPPTKVLRARLLPTPAVKQRRVQYNATVRAVFLLLPQIRQDMEALVRQPPIPAELQTQALSNAMVLVQPQHLQTHQDTAPPAHPLPTPVVPPTQALFSATVPARPQHQATPAVPQPTPLSPSLPPPSTITAVQPSRGALPTQPVARPRAATGPTQALSPAAARPTV